MRPILGMLALLGLAGCVQPSAPTTAPPRLAAVPYDSLPGWRDDDAAQAMPALLASCDRFTAMPADRKLATDGEAAALAGAAGQWRGLCAQARSVPPGDATAARLFIEQTFQPYAVTVAGADEALFTGYYEPQVAGSRQRGGQFQTPLLALPDDLLRADLGAFSDDLKGRGITGRVSGDAFVPYYDRAAIEAGALAGRRLELAWLADPADAFFLQVQGSGRVRLRDASVIRVGYAGQNGRPYVPIGRVLIENGEIPREKMSMQAIRAWMAAHPDQARALMERNPSFVFFRAVHGVPMGQGATGAFGVALTPGRSLAIDRRLLPLGAPVFLDTTDPLDGSPWHHLMLAQDTGGAIKGALRGDVYFGWGKDAEDRAGRMRQPGRLWLLLPRLLPAP